MKKARSDKRKESGQGHMKRMTARVGKEVSIKIPGPELLGIELVPKYVDCPVDKQKRDIVIWHAFMGERLDEVDTLNKLLHHDCSKMLRNRHVATAKIDHMKELEVKIAHDVLHALDLLWEVFTEWSDTLDAESKERCFEMLAQALPAGTQLAMKYGTSCNIRRPHSPTLAPLVMPRSRIDSLPESHIKFHHATLPFREIPQKWQSWRYPHDLSRLLRA